MSNLQDILKKSVKLVVENDISNDVLYMNQPIYEVGTKLGDLNEGRIQPVDFFIVFCDNAEQKTVQGVITYAEFNDFINKLIEGGQDFTKPISSLSLEQFPVKYSLDIKTATIDEPYALFKSNLTNIILALDGKRYVGKIKKSNFVEKLKLLMA